MESVLQPPPPFDFDNNVSSITSGNLSKSWTNWKKSFTVYFEACELSKKPEPVQINILLHVIGTKCREVYDQFSEKFTTLKQLIAKFDEYFLPQKNVTVERHRFFCRNQMEHESVEQYVFELNKMARSCEFESLCSDLVRDRLICGIQDGAMRERLLREPKLTLSKALDICKIAEMTRVQASNFAKPEVATHHVHEVCQVHGCAQHEQQGDESVHWVQRARCTRCQQASAAPGASGTRGARDRRRRGRGRGRGRGPRAAQPSTSNETSAYRRQSVCYKCGLNHDLYKCPAYGVRCDKCEKYNHYAKMCKAYYIEGASTDHVRSLNISNTDWSALLIINNFSLDFKLDTGADVNIIPKKHLNDIGVKESDLTRSAVNLKGYSGDKIPVLGKCNLKVQCKGRPYILKFIIADVNSPPILGRSSCVELDLIKQVMEVKKETQENKILTEFPDVFQGVGCLPGEYKIQINENVQPVVHPPRKLPIALRESVKNKLADMVSQGIIAKVEGPTDWVNSMTLAKKPDGDFRICLDPQDLNKAIKREHFKLPTLDEITASLSGSKYFSTLDAKHSFWQVKLEESCTDLCTFNTAFGRYKFLRLPFGISSASEVFHRKLFDYFDDMEGVCQFVDDLLIHAPTKAEHDLRLRKVLQRCREINIKLNKKKCKIGLREIKYLGHKISDKGILPDDGHISAIKNMPEPQNTKDLERFLGLITYLGSFIPNLSEKTQVLRELLNKEVEWHWELRQQRCFEQLKQCLVSPPTLTFYRLDRPVTLSVDASKNGLGCCLLQDDRPVGYGSKSLTKTERAYAQIEKELYACVFACEKFYSYIYGRTDITIETDHKPLISIIKKPISSAPPRLQRMLMRLQPYTFKLVYKPGRYLYVADALSRAYETNSDSEPEPRDHLEAQAQVCSVACNNPLTDTHFLLIQKCTCDDNEMQLLIKRIRKGWPAHRKETEEILRCYWDVRDELTVIYGLVWKGDRVVIPKCMRREMLQKVHVGHLGPEKCKLRAREIMYWPNMNSQLSDMINHCQACLKYKKANSKETLIQHDIPDRPWSKIAGDIFHFSEQKYLLVVDYYSKFVEVVKMKSITSEKVVEQLKNIFCRQGIPDSFMSDGGPEFSSEVFRAFTREWNFKHITSSPRYPQSNGQVERTIQTIKTILRKTSFEDTDFRLAFLEYLNTPLDNTLASPTELLNSRKLRSILPCSPVLLKPKIQKQVKQKLEIKRAVQKKYYDKNARDLKELTKGQKVKAWINEKWESGTVLDILRTRSYLIRLNNGGTIIRNRRHLRPDSEKRCESQSYAAQFPYDDITSKMLTGHNSPSVQGQGPSCVASSNTNAYVTRSGRTVRPPERWGYPATHSTSRSLSS